MPADPTGGEVAPGVTVSLRQPPPLDAAMLVTTVDGVTTAALGGAVIATAEPTDVEPIVVDPVPVEVARAAETTYAGLTSHPFPTCFVCGVDRAAGDGLRIFPGRVDDQDGATRMAATWVPDTSLAAEQDLDAETRVGLAATWAALDCVGGWAGDLEERLMVLARMTARVDALPVVGEEHVVVGLGRGREGRKTFTAATLYDSDGRVVARAEHLWVAVDPAVFS